MSTLTKKYLFNLTALVLITCSANAQIAQKKSLNLEGVRAEFIKQALATDIQGELTHAQQLGNRILRHTRYSDG